MTERTWQVDSAAVASQYAKSVVVTFHPSVSQVNQTMHKTLHKIACRNKTKDLAVRDNRPTLYIDGKLAPCSKLTKNSFGSKRCRSFSKQYAQPPPNTNHILELTHIYCVVQYDDVKFVTNVQPVAKSATAWNESFIM